MNTKSGVLPVGVEWNGEVHRDFCLRPARVGDVLKCEKLVGTKGLRHMQAWLIAEQITLLGTIPKEHINAALVQRMLFVDFNALLKVDAAMELELSSFREEDKGDPEGYSGTGGEDGLE